MGVFLSTNDDDDITKIEDLSDFEHSEDEESLEIDNLETESGDELDLDSALTEDLDNDDIDLAMQESFGDEDQSFELQADDQEFTIDDQLDEEQSFSNFDTDEDESHDSKSFNLSEGQEQYEEIQETSLEAPEQEPEENQSLGENLSEEEDKKTESPLMGQYSQDGQKTEASVFQQSPETKLMASKNETGQAPAQPVKINTEQIKAELKESLSAHIPKNVPFTSTPAFTIQISDIGRQSDAEEIYALLKEWKVITSDNDRFYETSINRGRFIIPRIGEYAAIFLAHRLRRFDVDIKLGLSQQIFTNETESIDKGTLTKQNIKNNKRESASIRNQSIKEESVIISTLDSLNGHRIVEHLGLVTIQKDIQKDQQLSPAVGDSFGPAPITGVNHDFSKEFEQLGIQLRPMALKKFGNAVIGIRYQVSPYTMDNQLWYKIICTGNVVWLEQQN
jgi:uncharacterized protein YbjQ (UPF0145 family)